MSTNEKTKAVLRKVERSGFHPFLSSVLPVSHTPDTRLDILGGVLVVSLLATVLLLMHLILVN